MADWDLRRCSKKGFALSVLGKWMRYPSAPLWRLFRRSVLPSRDNVIFTDSTSGSVSLLNFTTVGAAVVLVVGVGVVVVVVTTPLAAGLDSAPGLGKVPNGEAKGISVAAA